MESEAIVGRENSKSDVSCNTVRFNTEMNRRGRRKSILPVSDSVLNCLDTISIDVPINELENFEIDKLYFKEQQNGCWITDSEKTPLGIGIAIINPKTSTLHLEFSSKILGKDYFELINRNNIKKVQSLLCQSAIFINIDSDFLEKGRIRRVDVTKDVRFETQDELKNRIMILKLRINSPRYRTTIENTGVYWIKVKGKRNKEYFKAYMKGKELELASNRQLRRILSEEQLEASTRTIRFEDRLGTFLLIRQSFGITKKGDICLSDLLNSKQDAIAYKWLKIKGNIQDEPVKIMKTSSTSIGDNMLYDKLLEKNNYDLELSLMELGNFLKENNLKSYPTRRRKQLQERCNFLMATSAKKYKTNNTIELINTNIMQGISL